MNTEQQESPALTEERINELLAARSAGGDDVSGHTRTERAMTKQPKCTQCGYTIHRGPCPRRKPTVADAFASMPDWAKDAWLHGTASYSLPSTPEHGR